MKVEWKRIFSRKNIVLFTILFLLSQYLVFIGIQDYKTILDRKENFSEIEKLKVKNYPSYEMYAGTGFMVMCYPSPLVVFFRNSSDIGVIETNISSSDLIDVYKSKKGRRILSRGGKFGDLGGLILYFGTLLMLYMGMTTFKNKGHLKLTPQKQIIKTIASRLTILDLFFIMIIGMSFMTAIFKGISVDTTDVNTFIYYSIYSIVLLDVFFLLGLLSAFLGRFKGFSHILLLAFWLLFIFILPEVVYLNISNKAKSIPCPESIDMKKISDLLNSQKKINEEFMQTTKNKKLNVEEMKEVAYKIVSKFVSEEINKNNQLETENHNRIKELIQKVENVSSIFPGNYYYYLSGEISGVGYNEYIRFFKYILDLKDKFSNFYIQKRYLSDDKVVEPFVKGEENIFRAESRLPRNFWLGILITCLYCLAIFLICLALFRSMQKNRLKGERVEFELEELSRKRMYFVLCKNAEIRERLFKQVSEEPGVLAVDRIEGEDIDLELKSRHLLDYLCHIKGVKDREKVLRYLDELGGSDVLEKKKNETEPEDLKKIYLAVRLADDDKETILVNKYLTGATRSFEQKFIGVLKNLAAQNKRALYLSEEHYANLGITDVTERVKIKSGGVVSINITKIAVSLR